MSVINSVPERIEYRGRQTPLNALSQMRLKRLFAAVEYSVDGQAVLRGQMAQSAVGYDADVSGSIKPPALASNQSAEAIRTEDGDAEQPAGPDDPRKLMKDISKI